MICPVCKQAMMVVEHHQIELDFCPKCKGVWFDADELELLLASMELETPEFAIKNMLSLPEVERGRRKCPICGRNMKEVAIGQPAINIDVCRRGNGLWFDGGELSALLEELADKPSVKTNHEQQILSFLGDVFQARRSN